jgi:alpha-2-macroglobulin
MNISRRPLRLAFLLALTLITFSTQTGCKRNNPLSFNPAFAKYIAAYTSGQISIASSIKIQLTDALIKQINALQIPLQEVVTTSPRIEGAIQWVGGNTIELQPNAWLESNKKYQVNLTLEKFVATRPQHVEMVVDQIVPYDANASDKLRLHGKIITNDVCAVSALPQVLEANCGGKELAIQWSAADALNTYTFVIDSIAKKEEAQEIRLAWDASAIGGNASGELLQRIPSKNEFNVFMHQVIQMPEQHVQLLFSSPLDPSQDLNGLIDITDCSNEKFIIENNEVRVYPATPQIGAKSVVVHAGIKGLNGLITKEEQIFFFHPLNESYFLQPMVWYFHSKR